MIYHDRLEAHNSDSFFQHMDAEGTIGLSEWFATAPDRINELLAQLDEPTTITFETGRNYWWSNELLASHLKLSQMNMVDPRHSRNLAQELSVLRGYG